MLCGLSLSGSIDSSSCFHQTLECEGYTSDPLGAPGWKGAPTQSPKPTRNWKGHIPTFAKDSNLFGLPFCFGGLYTRIPPCAYVPYTSGDLECSQVLGHARSLKLQHDLKALRGSCSKESCSFRGQETPRYEAGAVYKHCVSL